MPSRYVVRNFSEGGVYHIYNRGVEKRDIFMSETDYKIFMYYLNIYLASQNSILQSYPNLPLRLQKKNLSKDVSLITYCLMPNHFHFLIQLISKDGITKFMKQLTNAYTEYFNKKYKRDGALMQGRYKALQIESDELLIHVSRYIHLNPVVSKVIKSAQEYPWSSASEYFQNLNGLCYKKLIQEHFSTPKKYQKFMLDHVDYAKKLETIKHLTIDS